MRRWRLILDGARGAAENMAIDEAMMLACADGSAPPTLRVYYWSSPSISLGFLQPVLRQAQDSGDMLDPDYCREAGIEVVRRITGGRAVIHGSDVTFSIALCDSDLPDGCSSVLASHRWLMGGIVAGLRLLGVDAEMGDRRGAVGSGKAMPADCFAHIAECDVRVGSRKAVGSAQVRRSGAILEQGSIPYAAPAFDTARVFGRLGRAILAADIPLAGLTFQAISQAVASGFDELLEGRIEAGELTAHEAHLAEELARDKYAKPQWTAGQDLADAVELV